MYTAEWIFLIGYFSVIALVVAHYVYRRRKHAAALNRKESSSGAASDVDQSAVGTRPDQVAPTCESAGRILAARLELEQYTKALEDIREELSETVDASSADCAVALLTISRKMHDLLSGDVAEILCQNTHPAAAGNDSFTKKQKASKRDTDADIEAVSDSDILCPGMSDRRTFTDSLGKRLSELKRGGRSIGVVLVRFDYPENDTPTDDDRKIVYRIVSRFFVAALREMDYLTLYDENTFGILLPGTTVETASKVCRCLLESLAKCVVPGSHGNIHFETHAGIAVSTEGDTAEDLLGRAECNLEHACTEMVCS